MCIFLREKRTRFERLPPQALLRAMIPRSTSAPNVTFLASICKINSLVRPRLAKRHADDVRIQQDYLS
ncbi:hypothetical protein Hanom_Chr05g00393191 [Helianthus anomalus]